MCAAINFEAGNSALLEIDVKRDFTGKLYIYRLWRPQDFYQGPLGLSKMVTSSTVFHRCEYLRINFICAPLRPAGKSAV